MVETVSASTLPQGTGNGSAASQLEPGTELKARVESNLPGGVVRLATTGGKLELRVSAPLPTDAEVTVTVSGNKQQPSIQITTNAGNTAPISLPANGAQGQGTPQPQGTPPQGGLAHPAPSGQTLAATPVSTATPAGAHLIQVLPASVPLTPGNLPQIATPGTSGTSLLQTPGGQTHVSGQTPPAGQGQTGQPNAPQSNGSPAGQPQPVTVGGAGVSSGSQTLGNTQGVPPQSTGSGAQTQTGSVSNTPTAQGSATAAQPGAPAGGQTSAGTIPAAAPQTPSGTGGGPQGSNSSAPPISARPGAGAGAGAGVGAASVPQQPLQAPMGGAHQAVLPQQPAVSPTAAGTTQTVQTSMPQNFGLQGQNPAALSGQGQAGATASLPPGAPAATQAPGTSPQTLATAPNINAQTVATTPTQATVSIAGQPVGLQNPAAAGGSQPAAASGSVPASGPVPAGPIAPPSGSVTGAQPVPQGGAGGVLATLAAGTGGLGQQQGAPPIRILPGQPYQQLGSQALGGPGAGIQAPGSATSQTSSPATANAAQGSVTQIAGALAKPLSEQQAGLTSLFAQIGTLMSAQNAGNVALPDSVTKAMQQILGLRLNLSGGPSANDLQQAVRQSGQFREAQLALPPGTGGSVPDLKSVLLSFKSLLQQLGARPEITRPAGQPAAPSRHAAPQGQAPQAASGYWAGAAPENLQALMKETDAALARLRLTQLSNAGLVRDGAPQVMAKPLDLVLELPLALGQETAVMQMQIGRDGAGNQNAEEGEPSWRLRFALDLTATGPLEAAISLRGGGTYASLWVDRKDTFDNLNAVRETMEAAFADAGLDLQELRLIRGLPPKTAAYYGAMIDRQS